MNLLDIHTVYLCETGFDHKKKEVRIWMNLKDNWTLFGPGRNRQLGAS